MVSATLTGEPVAAAKVPSLLKLMVPVDEVEAAASAGSVEAAQSHALAPVFV